MVCREQRKARGEPTRPSHRLERRPECATNAPTTLQQPAATRPVAEFVAAQDRFGCGETVGAIGNTGATDEDHKPFSDVITHTGIDLSANALEIGIHAESVPTPPSIFPGPGDFGQIGPVGQTGVDSNGTAALNYVEMLLAAHINVSYYAVKSERVDDNIAFEGGRTMSNGGRCTSGFTVTNKFVCNEAHGQLTTCRVHSVGPGRLMMMGHHVCH